MKKNLIFIKLLFILFLFISCNNKKHFKAEKGIIDLRKWNFENDGIVKLDGDWEFYNNELLCPDDLEKRNPSTIYTEISERWRNNKRVNLGRYGYVTYRLKILLDKKYSNLCLRIPNGYVAYKIWINKKYIFNNGNVAKNRKDEIPRSYPREFYFSPDSDEIEIIIQNSNFHDESGGFINSILLGKSEQIMKYVKKKLAIDLFLFGAIIIFSLYNLIIFLLRKKEISPLIFFLICVIISIRVLLTNECFLYYIFPNFNFELSRKLEYLTICIGPSLFVFFSYKQFVKYNIKKIVFMSQIIGLLFSLIIIFTQIRIYSNFLIVFQIKMIFDFLYVLYVFIRAILNKEIEAVISLLSFIIPVLIIIYEILYHYQIFLIGIFTPLGLVIYIFGQSFILSLRFAKAYSKLEIATKELKTYSKRLEKKVKERTNELEESNKQKTNFFINFAHETKTPLTLISNYFNSFIKRIGYSPESIIIQENLDKLRRNIVNILDIEKLSKGQIYYDHSMVIDLSKTIHEKILLFKNTADKKEINIYADIQKNIFLKIDAYAIDRILNNLLDNAIKYNAEKGKINIKLKADKKTIKLFIKDNGIGIDKEKQKNIFDPYYQLSHQKRNIQGIGIGLSIVKRIIDDLNGEILINSELNQGSEFVIKLKRYHSKKDEIINEKYKPAKPIKILPYKKIKDSEYDQDKYNIFVIEDNIELLMLLKDSMYEKYNFFYSLNGEEALKKINNIPNPHLIISDIMMDKMDGFTFFEKLYNIEKYKSIPFIFLTAKNLEEDKIKGLSKGAIDFISKPFIIEELLEKIKSILKNQSHINLKIHKEISVELYDYLKEEISSVKNIKNNKKSKIEYDIIGKLFSRYKITRKELEIIDLLKEGYEYKEICTVLNIQKSTVNTYISKIFKKCNVNSTKELIDLINNFISQPL